MSNDNDTGWKGKTRGGSFGYLFFILLIKGLGQSGVCVSLSGRVYSYRLLGDPCDLEACTAAVRIWTSFRPFSVGQLLPVGANSIDKVAVGGMDKQYTFDFGTRYQDFWRY